MVRMDQSDFYSEDDDNTPLNQLAFRRKKKFKRLRRARGDDMPQKKNAQRRVYVDNALNRRLGRVGKPYGHHHMKRAKTGAQLRRTTRARTVRLADGTQVRLANGDYQIIAPKKGGGAKKKLTACIPSIHPRQLPQAKAVMSAGGPRDRMRKIGQPWRARRGWRWSNGEATEFFLQGRQSST